MIRSRIYKDIDNSQSQDEVFNVLYDFFRGQGFGGLCYVAPEAAAGPYVLLERGMPAEWMAKYREQGLADHDPIPGMAFRLGHPSRIQEVLKNLRGLNPDEQQFVEAFKTSGMTDGILVPTYGPLGRPALVGLTMPADPALAEHIDISLAGSVAQHAHIRMELLHKKNVHEPNLSPTERNVLKWLIRGKSNNDIATILGMSSPTVATHVQRIYHKMQVNDRVNCVAKALATNFF